MHDYGTAGNTSSYCYLDLPTSKCTYKGSCFLRFPALFKLFSFSNSLLTLQVVNRLGQHNEPLPASQAIADDMETSAESARPLALLQTIPSDVLELSSIWQLLHVELVQQILDHLIEDLLTCCKASEIYSTAENSAILEDVWFNFRHNDLFKSRKSLIERHFHDHWLSCVEVSIYIGGPGHSGFESCCRYTHASHGHKSLGVLLDPELTPSNDGNPELEKVVFCLAELNATRRADLVRMWDKVINAGGTECYPLHIAPPPNGDGHHRSFSSTTRRLLEDWEMLDDGDRIRFPWKKLMTMVLTYIMGLWRTDDRNESTVPLGTLELWFIPQL